MKFAYDLAFVFVDLGDSWWRTAVTEMLRSAERVLPHARFVQLSDSTTPIHPWAHKILRGNVKCQPQDFAEFRAFLIGDHLRKSELPTVLSGADVIWCGAVVPDIPASAEVHEVMGYKRVHFPGPANRVEMIRFARALDGGKQFDELAPTRIEDVKRAPNVVTIDLPEPLAGEPGFGAVQIRENATV